LLIVLELAAGGELFDFLSFTGCFDEQIARTYFRQLISGLKDCHGQKIAHRDLKPENLLMDENYALKIADFGFAHMGDASAQGKHLMQTECGTKGYMAPEVLAGKKYDESADLFSSAVILFIMLAGFPPFQFATKQDWWYNKIMNDKFSLFWKAHERSAYFSDAAKDLINKMLSCDPTKRLSIAQIEDHEWFKGAVLTAEELKADLAARAEKVKAEKKKEKELNPKQKGKIAELDSYIATRGLDEEGIPIAPPVLYLSGQFGQKALFQASEIDDGMMDEHKFVSAKESVPEVYEEAMAVYTKFDTTATASVALQAVCELFRNAGCKYAADKATYTVRTKISGASSVQMPNDDEGEDGLPLGPAGDDVTVVVKVYQSAQHNDRRTVVFKRLNGSSLQFQKLYNELIGNLGLPIVQDK